MNGWTRRGLALIVAVVCCGTAALAIERTKIPPLSLTDRHGQPRASESLQRSGQWLLIVVHPSCRACDTVLEAVAALPAESAANRLVVVIADGTDRDVTAAIERFPSLAGIEWLTGPSMELSAALKLGAASAVFGIRGAMIEWTVSGVLTDPGDIRSITAAWLNGNTP